MRRLPLPLMVMLTLTMLRPANSADAAERMLFWNLTSSTITALRLAPAGTTAFGANQCANDRDGAVDHDERLRLTGIQPGRYDVQITDRRGRACIARDVQVSGGKPYAFSLADEDLRDCGNAAPR